MSSNRSPAWASDACAHSFSMHTKRQHLGGWAPSSGLMVRGKRCCPCQLHVDCDLGVLYDRVE
eukprot:61171-Chlamydomonas_euryale.AAC.1